jgi:hypothetical protein
MRGLLLIACASLAFAQAPERFPPTAAAIPRTHAEWLAAQQEQDRVSKERGSHFREAYPEYALQWDLLSERIERLPREFAGDETVYDRALAERLIAELFADYESPQLNAIAPDQVGDILNEVASWPEDRLPAEARRVLADGLREYLSKGGGRYSPWQQASFATALDRLAPDDAGSQAEVEALLVDALDWAVSIDDNTNLKQVQRLCEARWGPPASLLRYELDTKDELPDGPRPEQYEKAADALRALLTDPPADAARLFEAVQAATEGALAELENKPLADDLVNRLLIAYRALLERRPAIRPRAVFYIENELLRLAVRERLKTDRHWELWSAAVREVGRERISERLKRFLRAQLAAKGLPAARQRAIDSLRLLVAE